MTRDRNENCYRNRKCFYDDETNSEWYVESYDNPCKESVKITKPKEMHQKKDEPCCCKEALKQSLQLLTNPLISTYITPGSFRLIGDNFNTGVGTLTSFSACGDSTLTHTNTATPAVLTRTTFCDLIAINFTITAAATPDIALDALVQLLTRSIERVNPRFFCCCEESGCCCNLGKASILTTSMSPVTIGLNTSALSPNRIGNLSVLTVSKDVAWLIDTTVAAGTARPVYIVCLDKIYSIV